MEMKANRWPERGPLDIGRGIYEWQVTKQKVYVLTIVALTWEFTTPLYLDSYYGKAGMHQLQPLASHSDPTFLFPVSEGFKFHVSAPMDCAQCCNCAFIYFNHYYYFV